MKPTICRNLLALLLLAAVAGLAGCTRPANNTGGPAAPGGSDMSLADPDTTGSISGNTASPRGFTAGRPDPSNTPNDGFTLGGNDTTDSSGTGPRSPAAPGGSLMSMPLMNQGTEGGSYPHAYCGPTTVRMVLAHYGIQAEPDEVALTDFGSGPMYRRGAGSTHEGMATALRHYGLNADLSYGKNLQAVRDSVEAGNPVIVNLKGNYGPFYTNGHITVVVGFTEDGDPIINDSAGGVQRTIPARTFLNTWQGLMIKVSR